MYNKLLFLLAVIHVGLFAILFSLFMIATIEKFESVEQELATHKIEIENLKNLVDSD